jgi:hypothetical protein
VSGTSAPPGHQFRLFDPAPGAAPTYRVMDGHGAVVTTTAVLGAAVVRARALAAGEGQAWITDTAGAAAHVGADGAITSDACTGWVALAQTTPTRKDMP